GGPLLQAGIKAQLGVVGFTEKGLCGWLIADIFTRVAPYIGWMQKTTHSAKLTC
ncbi:hypothetical protein Trydic_g3753, partial [Trypoxylus dichotomus]